MCKICAFFEGGMSYNELCDMPVDEFFKVVECANEIARKREAELNKK